MPRELVTKGWYVEGFRTEGRDVVRLRSRVFHVLEAANNYAAELRKATDKPETVVVCTKQGIPKGDIK